MDKPFPIVTLGSPTPDLGIDYRDHGPNPIFMPKRFLLNTLCGILLSVQCACFNPHHVFDLFKNQSEPLSEGRAGLIFYDWWRTQPGVLIVNSPNGNCAAVHMMGYKMGEWPGQFCLLLPGGRSFSALVRPTLKDSEFKKIWTLNDVLQISDAYWDNERGWIWLLVEKPGPQKILGVNARNGEVLFQWSSNGGSPLLGLYEQHSPNTSIMAYTKESLIVLDVSSQKQISASPLLEAAPLQQLDNENILYRHRGFSELTEGGRLAWQWQPEDPLQMPWGRKAVGIGTSDFMRVFRSSSLGQVGK